ncbi:hypothetical protein [Streptomyces chrestomyceticus]|uniref:hypothetical protein n=1 Tax=Streptomyces chrestomyceticus TaxID=68185 RepID=UPI0033E86809
MKTLLGVAVEMLVIATIGAAWAYSPFRAWLRRRIVEPVNRNVVRELKRRRIALARRQAEVLFAEARHVLPEVVAGRVPPGRGLAPLWVVRWWYAAQLAVPLSVAAVLLLALFVWNADTYATLWHPMSRGDAPEKPDPLHALVQTLASVPRTIQAWEGPADAFESLRGVLMVVIALPTLPLFLRLGAAFSEGPEQRQRRERLERQRRVRTGDYVRCWPVVVLIVAAVQCARAHRRWTNRQPGEDVPRVSMRAVERVIWRAHRTRRGKARPHHEQTLKAHAAQVVGALRAAEAKQDTDPGKVLRDLTVMLLTIAERYADGQVGRLLDDEQVGDVTPVIPRERLRLVAVGTVVVLLMAGASIAGLPDAALTALLPVVVLAAVIAFNRGKVPSPRELTDLVIPR